MKLVVSAEVLKILNDPSITWKVRRALLRLKTDLTEDAIEELVPSESYDAPVSVFQTHDIVEMRC
jgi:hypothetical protein